MVIFHSYVSLPEGISGRLASLSSQARFLRSSIFSPADPDMGTAGILKVQVISAKNLRNADIIGASDPYVVVTVGLQSAQTHVIEAGVWLVMENSCGGWNMPESLWLSSFQDNLNPTWNCTLSLPLRHSCMEFGVAGRIRKFVRKDDTRTSIERFVRAYVRTRRSATFCCWCSNTDIKRRLWGVFFLNLLLPKE